MQNTLIDPKHNALSQSIAPSFSTQKQAVTPPSSERPQRYFEPIGFEQAVQINHRFNHVTTPVLDMHYFHTIAFRKAKEALGWDVPAGAFAFNLIDLRKVFLKDIEFNQRFECFFFKTKTGDSYHAWIHKNNEGIVRYYAQHPYDADERYMFDVVDLYGFVFGGYNVVDYDKQRYLRHVSFDLVREQQSLMPNATMANEKERLRVLESKVNTRWKRQSTGHQDATLLATLIELIKEANKRTFVESHYDEKGRVVFFLSTSELMRRIKDAYADDASVKKGKATLSNAFNLLVGLGFIEKLSDDTLRNINPDLADNRNIHARGGKNPVSYYILNDLPTMYWVKKQTKKLNKKKVTLHNVTQRRFERAFGKELRETTFNQPFLETKAHTLKAEKQAYTQAFYWHLKQHGYVTKLAIEAIIPSANVANKLWTDLVNETRGLYIKRTSKSVRDTLGIETTGAVFVASRTLHPFEPGKTNDLTPEQTSHALSEKEYTELVESALFWFGTSRSDYGGAHSEWDDWDEPERYKTKEGESSMVKKELDRSANMRFEDDVRMEQEDTMEFESLSPEKTVGKPNPDNLKSQLREPQTKEDEEKIKRANQLLKGWGV